MEENIITIKQRNEGEANKAFAFLMNKTESELNDRAKRDKGRFKGISASDLEKLSCDVIRDMCSGTPFRPDEVKLVSGAKFPDIMAEKYYGVEVKSTIKDHWTSTGSSIVESTRDKYVENIYMLFGKLGGIPEFKCRPYQDVLSEIAVTHCPRYLINMDLKAGDSIFDKMSTTYDKLRTAPDTIEQVRKYYRQKAKDAGKVEMPWWLGDGGTEDTPVAVNVTLWKNLSVAKQILYTAQMFILFPEVLVSRFDQAALWLCATNGVLNSHFRDIFSAGGAVRNVDGKPLADPLPKVYKTLTSTSAVIKECFKDKDFMDAQVREYNPEILNDGNPYENWIVQITRITHDPRLGLWVEDEATLS